MARLIDDPREVERLCWGLAFYGVGGGGMVEAGQEILAPALAAGKRLTLVSPDELAPETFTAWAIIVGGKDPEADPPAEELARYGMREPAFPDMIDRLSESARMLAAHRDVELGALVSMELSSAATAATIATGLALGIPTIDGDYVGRAIPEISLNTLELAGLSPDPIAMVDRWGNRTLLQATLGAPMADRLGRMISRAAFGRGIATTGHLRPLAQVRPALVAGSLTRALEAGTALLAGEGPDRLAPLLRATGGRILFQAEAGETVWRDDQPYAFRELDYHLTGTGPFAGEAFRIWVKNEHHAVLRNGRPIATSPDVIAVLDAETNRPLTTLGEVTPGRRVNVVGVKPLDPVWSTPAGRALLGPRHFGLDFDYVDFETA